LRLSGQPAECSQLHDAIPVTLEGRPPITQGRREDTLCKTLLFGAKNATTVKIEVH
jgi:hypothetical protein